MYEPNWSAFDEAPLSGLPGRSRARRLLLEQLRQAITTEPAALQEIPNLTGSSLTSIRGRLSLMIGTIVVRLNREGFDGSERIYLMRDGLASGRAVDSSDVQWLDDVIAGEAKESTA